MPELPIVVGGNTGLGVNSEDLPVRTPMDDALPGVEIAALSAGIPCAIRFFGIAIGPLSGRHPADRSGVLMGHALGFTCFLGLMGNGSFLHLRPTTTSGTCCSGSS